MLNYYKDGQQGVSGRTEQTIMLCLGAARRLTFSFLHDEKNTFSVFQQHNSVMFISKRANDTMKHTKLKNHNVKVHQITVAWRKV